MRKVLSMTAENSAESIKTHGSLIREPAWRLRERASTLYSELETVGANEALMPFFDDSLFEVIGNNIRCREAMLGLPNGYASDLPHERLMAVSGVRIVLRPNNLDLQADTHNKTIENYIKLALLSAGDVEVATVFLATLLAEIELHGIDAALAQQIFWLWAPFADLIGKKDVKNFLESSAMKAVYAEDYNRIDTELNELLGLANDAESGQREALLAEEARSLEEYLNELFTPFDIYVSVTSRVKSHFAIWQKLQSMGNGTMPLRGNVFDYLGFRVVVSTAAIGREDVFNACKAIDNELNCLFERTWEEDYADPKRQSDYRAIHSTARLPRGMFGENAEAEFQVRSKEQDNRLETDSREYFYYSARKWVPGKKSSSHVRRAKHHIYDWRSNMAKAIAENDGTIPGICLKGSDTDDETLKPPRIMFFDKHANLHMAHEDETALDAMFRVHSAKVFRLERLYHGEGYIDSHGRPVNLQPIHLHTRLRHGIRLVAQYRPKGSERIHPGWKQIVVADEAKKRIDKKIKELETEKYVAAGETKTIQAIEHEHIYREYFRNLTVDDWEYLCQKYGLTVPNGKLARDVLLRDIGFGDQKPTRIVAYIIRKIQVLSSTVGIKEIVAKQEVSVDYDGIPFVRAQCCSSIELVDGNALAIASRRNGGIMHLHSPICSHMAGLVEAKDSRLIEVLV